MHGGTRRETDQNTALPYRKRPLNKPGSLTLYTYSQRKLIQINPTWIFTAEETD